MQRSISVILSIIFVFFTFSENEIYKKDIRNRLVIQGIGIDLEENGQYTVTLQAVDTDSTEATSSDDASSPPLKVYKLSGDTIYTAIKTVVETEGKIPLYSQNRIIVLGKSITKEQMDNVIDFFVRDVENGSSVYIAAAEDTAGEILSTKSEEGYVGARSLEQSIKSYEYDAKIFKIQLFELINRYNSRSRDFAMPLLAVKENGGEKTVEIIGTALFDKTLYRDEIDKDETIYLNVLCDNVNNTAVAYGIKNDTKVSLNIIKSKTRRTVKIEKNIPAFKISVKMDADIAEISGGASKAMTQKEMDDIKAKGEEYLEKQIQSTVSTLYKKHNSDACGLGRLIYIFYKDFYRENEKNLDSILERSLYEVEVELNIRRIGHDYMMG